MGFGRGSRSEMSNIVELSFLSLFTYCSLQDFSDQVEDFWPAMLNETNSLVIP
jgi:hypothetical protein